MDEASMSSQLRTPWRIDGSTNLYPRIVDAENKPVCAFGNQGQHRGIAWAIVISREIVRAVNTLYSHDHQEEA